MGPKVCESPATLMPGQQVSKTPTKTASLLIIFASALVSHNLTLSLAICRRFASRLSASPRESPAECDVMFVCDFFLPKHLHRRLKLPISRTTRHLPRPEPQAGVWAVVPEPSRRAREMAQKQSFLRRAKMHSCASKISMILEYQEVGILGTQGYMGRAYRALQMVGL